MKVKFNFDFDLTAWGIGIQFDYIECIKEFDINLVIGPILICIEIKKK